MYTSLPLPDNAINNIITERETNGKFDGIDDFFNRVTNNGKKLSNLKREQ